MVNPDIAQLISFCFLTELPRDRHALVDVLDLALARAVPVDPELPTDTTSYIDGSVHAYGDQVRVRLCACSMRDHTVLCALSETFPTSLDRTDIARTKRR